MSDKVIDENIEEGSLEFYNHKESNIQSIVKVIPKIMIEPNFASQE